VDALLTDRSVPGGYLNWREIIRNEQYSKPPSEPITEYDKYFERRHANFPRGTRLTPERILGLRIGDELNVKERALAIEMLHRREAALLWDFTEIGKVRSEVAPP